MRLLLIGLSCALAVPAGVIQGVALEWASGKPLSRTIVHLRPIAGSGTQTRPLQTRSGRSGQFQFDGVPDGLYILETQREGYLPAAYGQRRPTGHGSPLAISKESNIFAELRLHHMGAITGTVLDENGIGIPRVNVVAYRAQLPLRIAGRGVSDDRGVYRIAGLELGRHWVRTGGHTLDDGTGLLPLFGSESREPRDALIHEVRFDNDTPDANIRPEPGTLASLSGTIVCDKTPGAPVDVTLFAEFVQLHAQGACGGVYSFQALAPAFYEIVAAYTDGTGSGFAEQYIGRNIQLPLQVVTTQPVTFRVQSASTRSPLRLPVKLIGRRDDLSGPGPLREIPFPSANLPAGYWELAAAVAPGQYVASISGGGHDQRRHGRATRPADWFSVYVEPWTGGGRISILISENAAQLSGIATLDGKPAPGMPVFLWPEKEETRRILAGPRETRTDVAGRFRFTGLPPGAYRAVASMDFRDVTAELAEESHAKAINLIDGQSMEVDLTVWLAP